MVSVRKPFTHSVDEIVISRRVSRATLYKGRKYYLDGDERRFHIDTGLSEDGMHQVVEVSPFNPKDEHHKWWNPVQRNRLAHAARVAYTWVRVRKQYVRRQRNRWLCHRGYVYDYETGDRVELDRTYKTSRLDLRTLAPITPEETKIYNQINRGDEEDYEFARTLEEMIDQLMRER